MTFNIHHMQNMTTRLPSRLVSTPRPLSLSLSRLPSASAICAALLAGVSGFATAIPRPPGRRFRRAGLCAAQAAAIGAMALCAREAWAATATGTTKTTCTLKYVPDGTSSYWVMRVDPLEVKSFQLTVEFDPTKVELDTSFGQNFNTGAAIPKETFTIDAPVASANLIRVSGSRTDANLSPGDVDLYEIRFRVHLGGAGAPGPNPPSDQPVFRLFANGATNDFITVRDSVAPNGLTTYNAGQIGEITRIATPGINPLVWDPDANYNAGGTGGAGTWDTTNMRFDDLPSTAAGVPTPLVTTFTDVAWSNSTNATDMAIFGGNPGTGLVTLGEDISVGGLRFDMPGYKIQGNTLTLSTPAGSIPTIDIGEHSATISSNVVAVGGLCKVGSGTLLLQGITILTGNGSILAGVVNLGDGTGAADSAALDLEGGGIDVINLGIGVPNPLVASPAGNGTVTVNTDGTILQRTGAIVAHA